MLGQGAPRLYRIHPLLAILFHSHRGWRSCVTDCRRIGFVFILDPSYYVTSHWYWFQCLFRWEKDISEQLFFFGVHRGSENLRSGNSVWNQSIWITEFMNHRERIIEFVNQQTQWVCWLTQFWNCKLKSGDLRELRILNDTDKSDF